jgi:dienelactone hydrolase
MRPRLFHDIASCALLLWLLWSDPTRLLAAGSAPSWDLAALSRPPQVFRATNVAEGVEARFFAGLPYRGEPTRVFAFYGLPTNATSRARVPGVVLVHGGGGTAFAEWVRLWTGRGYAAIAMDLCGCLPVGSYGKWERHADGGPPGWGGFDQIDAPPGDQWTYHAVADILLAHSFLRGLPEVDPDRIGITGISWGGYLTCIAAGVDRRFRCAVPVYGCGFLGVNSAWLADFERLGRERAERWLAWWDPASYLDDARLPALWVNGSNDFAYPMDSWQRSYRHAPGPRTLCLKVRMPHAHGGAGENPEEIHTFMNARLRGGPPLARVTGQGRAGLRAWATCRSGTPIQRAELNYTRSAGRWQDRLWETVPAVFDSRRGRAEAELPVDATVWYANFVDARGLVVSTEHEVIAPSAGR